MSFYDLMGMSLGNLWRRKLRTVLTVLGVLIGTTSIVAMLSLALGMKSMLMKEFEGMGSITQITVNQGEGSEESQNVDASKMLTDSNMELFGQMEHVESVSPRLTFDGSISLGKYNGSGTIIGVDQETLRSVELAEGDYPENGGNSLQMVAGNQVLMSFGYVQGDEYVDYYSTGELPDIDLMTQVHRISVYDDSAMEETQNTDMFSGDMGEDSGEDAGASDMGDVAADGAGDDGMRDFRIKVTGIQAGGENDYTEYSYAFLTDIDALKAYLSRNFGKGKIPCQPKLNGRPLNEWVYSQITVNVDEAKNVDSVMQEIQDMGFMAQSNKELLESSQKSIQIVELVLGGIGMVAFLVAAIGIANTMMMSTYERTKEIGIMKVLGCDMNDIRKLFLMEAGFIGLLGGAFGLGLTGIVSIVINHVAKASGQMQGNISVIPLWLALAAIGFSTMMGMLAGYFPARRAMKLSPLAAIHTE